MSIYDQFSPRELDVLRTRAERVARPIENRQINDAISALIVAVGGEIYAIPTDSILGVYEGAVIVPVPCVPEFVAGLTNIRGHIFPVVDLARLLNVESEMFTTSKVVVVTEGGLSAALLVTETTTTQTVSGTSFLPVPEGANLAQRGHLEGLLVDGTALLNIESILTECAERITAASH